MEDLNKLSRKEREKLVRKQEIQQAAAKLFAEKGFNNTTLEDIAASAEFGIGTIYNYFQSKEEIFRSIIENVFDENLKLTVVIDQESKSLVEFFRTYTRRVFEYLLNNKESLIMLVTYFTSNGQGPINLHTERIEPKYCQTDDRIINRIKKGIEDKEIRGMNPEYLYYCYRSMVFPYITHLVKANKLNEFNRDEHADLVLDILFNGILTNKPN